MAVNVWGGGRTRSYQDFRALKRFPGLDGLRAISVLLVAAFHANARRSHVDWLSGWSGVTVFFVLSGFLITSLGLREEDNRGNLGVRAFYIRRVFRILPLYYLVLGIYVVLVFGFNIAGHRDELRHALPFYLTFRNEYAGVGTFVHSWSLGVEEKFYFVWPLLAFVVLRGRHNLRIAAAVIAAIAVLVGTQSLRYNGYLLPYGAILVGCVFALLLHNETTFRLLRWLGHPLVATALGVGWLVAHIALHEVARDRTYLFYPLAVAAVIVAFQLVESGPMASFKKVLERPLVVRLGVLSYAFYLLHPLGTNLARKIFIDGSGDTGTAGRFVIIVVMGFIGSEVLHRIVEVPLMHRGRAIAARVGPRSAPATPTEDVD
jgi:peptidoglycan/LPS O-acetylase OafA/YrhL